MNRIWLDFWIIIYNNNKKTTKILVTPNDCCIGTDEIVLMRFVQTVYWCVQYTVFPLRN